jgi:hypothetical protein
MDVKISQAEWAHIRGKFIDRVSRMGIRLELRDRVWAVTEAAEWIALPGTSDSPVADRWWLGCDPAKLLERQPVGIVLLCKARGGSLHAIGLPRALLLDIEPKLSKNDRHVFFSVVRRGTRFLLQLRGGEELDVTAHLDDLSWAHKGGEGARRTGWKPTHPGPAAQDVVRETPEATAPTENRSAAAATRFFAVVKNGALHPLDDVTLEAGSLHLVEIREAPSVPGNRSLRRILARGGPPDLPADLAEQHDHYAHGRVRR